jgi:spore germination cell wall hydrolase CwlJ-like protein
MKTILNSCVSISLRVVLRLLLLLTIALLVSSLRAQSATVSVSSSQIVAATLILEAGGEGNIGMQAVREVIANRAKNKTEMSVCLARKQFSCWNNISPEDGIAKAKQHPLWAVAVELAKNPVATNLTLGATHYHTLKVSPNWKNSLTKTVRIRNHIFYK